MQPPARALIDLESANQIIRPTLPACIDILLEGVATVTRQDASDIRMPMRQTTLYSWLADHFYDHMGRSDNHGKSFLCQEWRSQRYIYFLDQMAVRFKHVRKNFLSSNAPTRQSRLWNGLARLPGMEPVPRLEIGYLLDASMSQCIGIHLIQRIDGEVDWRMQVYGDRTSVFDGDYGQVLMDDGTTKLQYAYRPIK